jgi:hypothetical protein
MQVEFRVRAFVEYMKKGSYSSVPNRSIPNDPDERAAQLEDFLNEMGEEGYRLVWVDYPQFMFERTTR